MDASAEQYLRNYLKTLPVHLREKIIKTESFHFCDNAESANLCAKLTRSGKKRATASLEWCFTIGDESYPEVGELNVITNWDNEPESIIEITKIEVCPFSEVKESFAIDEGEGDLSLENWRKVHWEFFSRECKSLGKEPSESMPIVLQWFKVVYE